MADKMTPASVAIERALSAEFPGMRFGRFNWRPIGGLPWAPDKTASQHASGNALDLYAPAGHSDPGGFLDAVVSWLRAHNAPLVLSSSGKSYNASSVSLTGRGIGLGIKRLIWRQPGHYGHAHIDMWPTAIQDIPPADGGRQWFRYSTGRQVFEDNPAMEGAVPFATAPAGDDEEETTMRRGDKGEWVAIIQAALILEWDQDLGLFAPFAGGYPAGADGVSGSVTMAGVLAVALRLFGSDNPIDPDAADGTLIALILAGPGA